MGYKRKTIREHTSCTLFCEHYIFSNTKMHLKTNCIAKLCSLRETIQTSEILPSCVVCYVIYTTATVTVAHMHTSLVLYFPNIYILWTETL